VLLHSSVIFSMTTELYVILYMCLCKCAICFIYGLANSWYYGLEILCSIILFWMNLVCPVIFFTSFFVNNFLDHINFKSLFLNLYKYLLFLWKSHVWLFFPSHIDVLYWIYVHEFIKFSESERKKLDIEWKCVYSSWDRFISIFWKKNWWILKMTCKFCFVDFFYVQYIFIVTFSFVYFTRNVCFLVRIVPSYITMGVISPEHYTGLVSCSFHAA
jgi:hypothetical protein